MKKGLKVLLILLMFIATPVFASTNLYQANDKLTVDENLSGTSFIAGNDVKTSANIDGILFAAGNSVNISSSSDYAFVAGNIVNIEGASFKDGFLAGTYVTINNSTIERDLYAIGTKVTINSNVGRNAFIGGDDVVIDGVINGNIKIYASTITINSNAVINGKLSYDDEAKVTISKDATINETKVFKANKLDLNIDFKKTMKAILIERFFSFVNLLILALALMIMLPKLFEKITRFGKEMIASNIGFGLLTLIFIPIAALIIMCTFAGVYLGLLLLVMYVLSICLSTVLSAYYYGNMIFGNKIKNKYGIVTLTILILCLVKMIPFVGTLVSLVTLCTGLGIALNLIIKRK